MNARAEIKPVTLRCAIYTRKSSEEGLEQSFNSLDAQREACAAYIVSQSHEGWGALPGSYEDGGFSGGSMDRPGLKRLLIDIEAGLVDTIVVYKIDRLTRSLTDFSRMVELFDRKGVSFVSITQAFNTTTSMGRLTLNVLLSFAQFEREVTGERIRDKIAQSKAKGMWMGGNVLLGYDLKDRTLVINPEEAERVRDIYRRYLDLGSVHVLARALERDGVRSKSWTSLKGKPLGDRTFNRGALYHLLRNRHYLGEIVHKTNVHAGLHDAIVDASVFGAVQSLLAVERRRGPASKAEPGAAPRSPPRLTGRIFDAEGDPMCPTTALGKKGRRYAYYVSSCLQSGVAAADAPSLAPRRVSAPRIEGWVHTELARLIGQDRATWDDLGPSLAKIELRPATVELVLDVRAFAGNGHPKLVLSAIQRRLSPGEEAVAEPGAHSRIRVSLPMRVEFRGGRTSRSPCFVQASTGNADPHLVKALKTSHEMLTRLNVSPLLDLEALEQAKAPGTAYARRLCQIAFLAPELQLAILRGHQPAGLTVNSFVDEEVPLTWEEQRRWWRARS